MVIGQAEVHHGANDHLTVLRNYTVSNPADCENAGLGRIENGGKGIDLKHSEIGDGKASA